MSDPVEAPEPDTGPGSQAWLAAFQAQVDVKVLADAEADAKATAEAEAEILSAATQGDCENYGQSDEKCQ